MAAVVHQSSLHSLPLLSRGKVRDNYAVGTDRLLIVTTIACRPSTSSCRSRFPTRAGC
jgi:hypothetical protein